MFSFVLEYCVYILKSEAAERFYIGQTSDIVARLYFHNHGEANKYTRRFRPWSLFHLIHCDSREQARKIESHIKRMKSQKYLINLKMYPEIAERLKLKYLA